MELIHSAGSDHDFRTCFRPSVVRISQNKSRLKILIATGGTMSLTEGIIDDTCLVSDMFSRGPMAIQFNMLAITVIGLKERPSRPSV